MLVDEKQQQLLDRDDSNAPKDSKVISNTLQELRDKLNNACTEGLVPPLKKLQEWQKQNTPILQPKLEAFALTLQEVEENAVRETRELASLSAEYQKYQSLLDQCQRAIHGRTALSRVRKAVQPATTTNSENSIFEWRQAAQEWVSVLSSCSSEESNKADPLKDLWLDDKERSEMKFWVTKIEEGVLSCLKESLDTNATSAAQTWKTLGEFIEPLGLSQKIWNVLEAKDSVTEKLNNINESRHDQVLASYWNLTADEIQFYEGLLSPHFDSIGGQGRWAASVHLRCEAMAVPTIQEFIRRTDAIIKNDRQRQRRLERAFNDSHEDESDVAQKACEDFDNELMSRWDSTLNDIATVLQHAETYTRFIKSQTTIESSSSPLLTSLLKLVEVFTSLEYDYVQLTATHATSWEEFQPSSCTSSLVEEVYYICQKTGERALATGNEAAVAGVFHLLNRTLSQNLGGYLEERASLKRMEGLYPRHVLVILPDENVAVMSSSSKMQRQVQQLANLSKSVQRNVSTYTAAATSGVLSTRRRSSSSALSVGGKNIEERTNIWINSQLSAISPSTCANNIERAHQYGVQMIQHLAIQFPDVFPNTRDDQYRAPRKLQDCLDALNDMCQEFESRRVDCIQNIALLLKDRWKSFLPKGFLENMAAGSSVGVFSYELSEADFEQSQANDPFVRSFVGEVGESLVGMECTLSSTNFSKLLEVIARHISDLVLLGISSKSFTQLGGFQLDQDIRILLSFFTGKVQDSPKGIREAFGKLAQVGVVLNVDNVHDVKDYYGHPVKGIAWELSADEVRTWLHQRVEFSSSDIESLNLD